MASLLGSDQANSAAEALRRQVDPARLPQHIAIIMDGNGRWARQHRLPSRLFGHKTGYKTVKTIVQAAVDLEVKVLTLYVFSNENWKRPRREVEGLMSLYEHATRAELPELHANGIQMRFIGRRDGLTPSLMNEMDRAAHLTRNNTKLVLNLALNYGGRAEIVDAARKLAAAAQAGSLDPNAITEDDLSAHMYSADLPDPDLLIRTAGEMRVSNFLLWGIAYSEIWVTQTLWPDFSPNHLVEAIQSFQSRERRFGALLST